MFNPCRVLYFKPLKQNAVAKCTGPSELNISKEEAKNQESIQSSTTTQGNITHKSSADHKATRNRQGNKIKTHVKHK